MEEDWALALGHLGWQGNQGSSRRDPNSKPRGKVSWAPGEREPLISTEKTEVERRPLKLN